MSLIEIRRTSRKGRGVFATTSLMEGDVVEEVPVVLVPSGQLAGTALDEYLFHWNEHHDAVAFGFLSFANHSPDPNAWVEIEEAAWTMRLIAGRDIEPGEELTVDYGCELWFEPVE